MHIKSRQGGQGGPEPGTDHFRTKSTTNGFVPMKNLLFVSTYPFPLFKGGNQHAFYFLKALAPLFNVYCLFFVPPDVVVPRNGEEVLLGLGINHYDLCHFRHPPHRGRVVSVLRRLAAFPGHYMSLATNSTGLRKIEKFISQYAIDIVHFEHFFYAKYACKITGDLTKVIVYHDLHHSIYRQRARFEDKYIAKVLSLVGSCKYYLFQRLLDIQVDVKVFLNADEMASLPIRAVHIPHIANQDIFYSQPRETEFFNILFLGSYNIHPNRISVKYIVDCILPALAKETKKFRFHIVGSGTERFEDLVKDSSVRHLVVIRGFERDINMVFQGMDIALFPILFGGGIKTKIIDAMTAGLPVVTTPEGVKGLCNLPGDCIGIGKTPTEILEQVSLLMRSYPLRLKRSTVGSQYVGTEHSFDTFSKRIAEIYLNL